MLTKADVMPFGRPGERRVAGQAFLRQAGGGVVTCAGETVTLVPAVTLVEDAVSAWRGGGEVEVSGENADVPGAVRWVECDASGNFAFEGLPPLAYWVMVPVDWTVSEKQQGGMLAEKISLRDGSAERIIIDDDDKLFAAKPWLLTSHL